MNSLAYRFFDASLKEVDLCYVSTKHQFREAEDLLLNNLHPSNHH